MEIREKSISKDEPILASGYQFFQFFKKYFKVEAAFPYSGNVFFNKSFIRFL